MKKKKAKKTKSRKGLYGVSASKDKSSSFFSSKTWKAALVDQPLGWGQTIANTLVDLSAGFVGAAGGSFLGWAGLPVGLAGAVIANKTGHTWARALSIGMMTAPVDETIGASRQATSTGFDFKAELDEGTQRMSGYFGKVYRKFGLHKVFGGDSTVPENSETVNGLGNATLDSLDQFDQQIFSSGIENAQGGSAGSGGQPVNFTDQPIEAFSVNGLDDLNTRHII
jgi:hypothetical protein